MFSAKLYHVFINIVVETLVNSVIPSYVYGININCVIQADDLALISLFWDIMHAEKYQPGFNSNKCVGMVLSPNMKGVLQDSFTFGYSEIQFPLGAIHLGLPVGSIPCYVDDRILKEKSYGCYAKPGTLRKSLKSSYRIYTLLVN